MAAAKNKKRSRSASSKAEGDLTAEDLAEKISLLDKSMPILESHSLLPDYFATTKPSKGGEPNTYQLRPLSNWDGVRSSPASRQDLITDYSFQFSKWIKYLEYGFNVLLYGVGSKIELLNSFFDWLNEYPTNRVKVFAFHPSFSVRKLLAKVQELVAKDTNTPVKQNASLTDMLTETLLSLDNCLEEHPHYSITILLNSLDAQNFKTEDAQAKISKLVAHRAVRLVATADNVNLARLWSLSILDQFNFVSFAVPTYEPYTLELSYMKDSLRFFTKHSADSALQGLKHVIMSMTTCQQQVLSKFVWICREQGKTQVGVKELLQACKSDFICTTEKQLMDYLMEARDHQVLSEKRTPRGERILSLLYPLDALGQILIC
mmetsp:Transcript_9766/g.19143  ORF Transcript_9766/g.19143 Transcript_9766/m.19143 type:complete len:376 (+) Transcript_9766:2001-3128(+)